MEKQRLSYLLEQFRLKKLTPGEKQELLDIADACEEPVLLMLSELVREETGKEKSDVTQLVARVLSVDRPGRQMPARRILIRRPVWAAACILLVLAGAAYLWLPKQQQQSSPSPAVASDVLPGTNGAVLTLANGATVVLDSLEDGEIARQAGAKVILQNGRLAYNTTAGQPGNAVYNTMSTPRGRQFQLTLPDGTNAWLNAASSIRYPTAFTGTERKVEISGEVYFEVAGNAAKPFIVQVNNSTQVEVLGTRFNVNAYTDEPTINTTLLEGAVKIKAGNNAQLLAPGQQAQVNTGNIKLVRNADIEQAVAWKNGAFAFSDADVPTVMRQLARWYNVEVRYEGAIPARKFRGEIERSLTLDELLKGLTRSGIHYKIENGKTITIMP